MSASVVVSPSRSVSLLARVSAYAELTKPKIAVMVLVAVAAAASVATWGKPDLWALLHALIGTLFVAGSSCAANHLIERNLDALMRRTAGRPLPQGKLTVAEVGLFSAITLIAGLAWLLVFTNPLTAALALATWVLYVLVYTPLKTRTPLNTAVGAIPGALPILIGWSCVEGFASGSSTMRAAGLFVTLFLWQFPHFMAIAWLYRQQYGQAGFKMLPTVDRTGYWSGIQAITCAAALVPVSLVPVLSVPGWGTLAYAITATCLGLAQLACAIAFAWQRDDPSARRLLRASLLYLPLLLASLVLGTISPTA